LSRTTVFEQERRGRSCALYTLCSKGDRGANGTQQENWDLRSRKQPYASWCSPAVRPTDGGSAASPPPRVWRCHRPQRCPPSRRQRSRRLAEAGTERAGGTPFCISSTILGRHLPNGSRERRGGAPGSLWAHGWCEALRPAASLTVLSVWHLSERRRDDIGMTPI
jgi:hypothetical protein